MKNVFEKIIDGELPCDKVFENEYVIAFKDIAPKAPVHILIVPKKSIADIQSVKADDYPLIGECIRVAQKLAEEFDVVKTGYRLLVNNGPNAGQTVPHLHFHLMGGRPLGRMAG